MSLRPRLVFRCLAFALAGCQPDPPGDGGLAVQVRVTENPAGDLSGLTMLEFSTVRIDVVHRASATSPERVITVDGSMHSASVSIVQDAVTQLVILNVPPGFVSQLRFVTGSVGAAIDGAHEPVKLPSGENTGLKFNPIDDVPFEIKADKITRVEGQFDPNNRMVRNKGVGLILKPTLPTVLLPDLNPDTPFPLQFAPHHVYVCFRDGTAAQRISEIHGQVGATIVRSSHRHPWQVVRLPDATVETDAIAAYKAEPEVALAMLDYNVHAENRDPTEWAGGNPQPYLRQTNSPAAWDITVGKRQNAIVAVVDNNVNIFSHDIQENLFLNQQEIPSQVTRRPNCQPLAMPIPLPTVDTDFDTIITVIDLNREPNLTTYKNALAARGEIVPAFIGIEHLLYPENPIPISQRPTALQDGKLRCGLWEDLNDDDMNNLPDDIVGWDFVVDRNTPVSSVPIAGNAPFDGNGHGHDVTGTLAAVSNELSVFPADNINTGGYVGQIWQTRVLPVRVLATDSPPGFISGEIGVFGDTGTVHDGLGYAVDMGADIVNMSFSLICAKQGTPGAVKKDANDKIIGDITCPPEMFDQKLADYRTSFDLAGLSRPLIVVAPANYPINLQSEDVQDLPAELNLPNQITVAAVELMDAFRREISAYGPDIVNLSAPSQMMPTLNFGGRDQVKTPGFSGLTMEPSAGNSLAAPQVAGAAALILAVSPELKANSIAIKDRILRNAVSIEANKSKVKDGLRLDVYRAVANTVP